MFWQTSRLFCVGELELSFCFCAKLILPLRVSLASEAVCACMYEVAFFVVEIKRGEKYILLVSSESKWRKHQMVCQSIYLSIWDYKLDTEIDTQTYRNTESGQWGRKRRMANSFYYSCAYSYVFKFILRMCVNRTNYE